MGDRSKGEAGPYDLWLMEWMSGVVDGRSTMSQRKATSIEKHGGIAVARALAEECGVHLLQLTDDKGEVLVAASLTQFVVLC